MCLTCAIFVQQFKIPIPWHLQQSQRFTWGQILHIWQNNHSFTVTMYGSRKDKYLQIYGHFMYTWSELFTWSELSSQTSTSYPCSLYYAWSVTMIHVKNKLFTEINMSYHLKYFTDIHVKKNTFTRLICWEYNNIIRSLIIMDSSREANYIHKPCSQSVL